MDYCARGGPLNATQLGDRRFLSTLAPSDGVRPAGGPYLDLLERVRGGSREPLPDADPVTRSALVNDLEHRLGLVEADVDRWAVDPLDGPQVTFLNVPLADT